MAHAVARQQRSHSADLDVADLVDGDRRAGLGQAVALVDGQAHAAEEVPEPRAQRCAPRHRRVAVAAQRRPQLVVHQPVEQRVLGPQQRTPPAAVGRLAPVDGGLHGHREDAALAVVGGVLLGGVVNLLEHPRHRHHHGRLEHGEHRQQVLDVAGESHGHLVGERGQGQRAGQHVGQRQEDQQPLPLVEQRRQALLGAAGLVEQVGMGQLAALGPPGGARGVDQGGRILGAQPVQTRGQLGRFHPCGRLGQLVEGLGAGAVDVQHPAQGGQLGGQLGDHRRVLVGLGECQHRLGVLQHPAHLLGGGRLVDRHGDRAHRQDRQVEDRPFVAGGREDRHPVAGLYPQ